MTTTTGAKHTPGDVVVADVYMKGEMGTAYVLTTPDHRALASVGDHHMRYAGVHPSYMVRDRDEIKANARRFAACWNACEGIPTEALEAGVVAELVATCKAIWEDAPDGNTLEDLVRFAGKLQGMALTAIRKATGGAA